MNRKTVGFDPFVLKTGEILPCYLLVVQADVPLRQRHPHFVHFLHAQGFDSIAMSFPPPRRELPPANLLAIAKWPERKVSP